MMPTVAAPDSSEAGRGGPSTTRVTVLTGRRMTDLVLPSTLPMEDYLDEAVTLLGGLLADAPADVLAAFDFNAQGEWAFARPGAPPMRPAVSLDEAGVVDGTLLTVVSVSRTERFRPLVEDVIDAIAVLDESPEFNRAALNRFVGLAVPPVAAAVSATVVSAWWQCGHNWWYVLALGLLGIGLLVGSASALHRQCVGASESLLLAALTPVAGAAALAVPLPAGTDGLGAPNVAAASTTVLLLILAIRGGPRKRATVASFVAVGAGAVAAAAVANGYGWNEWVPAGAIACGMIVVTNAAKLTVTVARIALPPIPAPGETVSNDELLDPVSSIEAGDEESPTWQAIIASIPRSAARLTERGHVAKQLQVGFLSAGVMELTVGAIAVVSQGHFLVHGVVVAGLVTVMCGFRARLYAERWCVWALLAAAVVIPTGVVIRLCLWYPRTTWLILSIYVATVVVALLVVGVTEGVRRLSPVTKRILELVDGAAIAAVIPLLLWIVGAYDMLRNLRF